MKIIDKMIGWRITDEMIERMKDAVEGECDGFAIETHQARTILEYVLSAPVFGGLARPNASSDCGYGYVSGHILEFDGSLSIVRLPCDTSVRRRILSDFDEGDEQ